MAWPDIRGAERGGRLARVAVLAGLLLGPAHGQQGAGNVVYVPTPQVVVDTMLRMANVGPADTLIDLGSGDGRIVVTAAKVHGARGLGVELDRHLLGVANEAARRDGVADRARFVEQDLFQTDLTSATVITTYLLPEMNLKLRPKILALPAGTRVVAHDYHFGEWLPDESTTLEVPEKKVGNPGISYVYLWRVPATASGRWQFRLPVRGAQLGFELELSQRFQAVSGTARAGGASAPIRNAELAGDALSLGFDLQTGGVPVRFEFRGRILAGAMEGTVSVRERAATVTHPVRAVRVGAIPRDDLNATQ